MLRKLICCLIVSCIVGLIPGSVDAAEKSAKKKIVLLGMNRDHAPGDHEYMAGLAVLAECLKQMPNVEIVTVQLKDTKDWPKDTSAFDDANTIVCFLRRAGEVLLENPKHRAKTEEW